jgi:2-desacetyl-2-hydroxyethyl bacteriochlorophyllide A dehydrogenase
MKQTTHDPETSIIIRAFNEEKHLPELLVGIRDQTYKDVEVIVVDSGSFDRTKSIAEDWGAKVFSIDSQDFTFGFSLNFGIRAARGKYIVITSAHTKPVDRLWLQLLIDALQEDRTAMVYGRQLGVPQSKFSEQRDFARAFGGERKVIRPPQYFANNANAGVRKDLWEKYRFDESLPGCEDIDWAKHWIDQGYQVVYEPGAAVYHTHDETWEQIRKRYYREAAATRAIGLHSRLSIPSVLGSELKALISDLGASLTVKPRSFSSRASAGEILRFRFNKTLGTTLGLMDGSVMSSPQRRDEIFYTRKSKAVVIEGPNRAEVQDLELPEVKPADVLIEVAYEGVCGTDLEILEGTLGYFKNGLAKYPIVPGHEFSGWVTRLGARVDGLRVGDPVVVECIQSCGSCEQCQRENWIGCPNRKEVGVMRLNGGYSRYVVAPARFVHKIPGELDMRKAALCEPLAVVHKGVRRLDYLLKQLRVNEACAVIGAGPIGHLCAQVLTSKGYRVGVFDQDPRRLGYFSEQGIEPLKDIKEVERFRVIIEATGDPEALATSLKKSSPGSTHLLLGLPYSRRPFNFEDVVAYDKIILGSVGSSGEDFVEAIKLLPKLPVDAFLQCVLPLEDYGTAWEKFRRRDHLKILLRVSGSDQSE